MADDGGGGGGGGGRLSGVQCVLPIVYGNVASQLSKKRDDNKTHKWICFIRGLHNENLSYCIKKVVFKLHPSFENANRVVEAWPFELVEYGWGEFDMHIVLHFTDPKEKPVTLSHHLTLFTLDPAFNAANMGAIKRPLVTEQYDELVFTNPREWFYNLLRNPPQMSGGAASSVGKSKLPGEYLTTAFDDSAELRRLLEAQQQVRADLRRLLDRRQELERGVAGDFQLGMYNNINNNNNDNNNTISGSINYNNSGNSGSLDGGLPSSLNKTLTMPVASQQQQQLETPLLLDPSELLLSSVPSSSS